MKSKSKSGSLPRVFAIECLLCIPKLNSEIYMNSEMLDRYVDCVA